MVFTFLNITPLGHMVPSTSQSHFPLFASPTNCHYMSLYVPEIYHFGLRILCTLISHGFPQVLARLPPLHHSSLWNVTSQLHPTLPTLHTDTSQLYRIFCLVLTYQDLR